MLEHELVRNTSTNVSLTICPLCVYFSMYRFHVSINSVRVISTFPPGCCTINKRSEPEHVERSEKIEISSIPVLSLFNTSYTSSSLDINVALLYSTAIERMNSIGVKDSLHLV